MAQCPTGYVGRLFWPCSHFSGFMGNGQNLWHPVHFCLEGRGHSAISYRTTGFPRLFLFFHLPLAALSWRRQLFLPLSLSLSPLCISCNRNSRRFHENYLQIIFIGGLSSVLSLERISFFSFLPSSIIWCFFDVSNIRYIYVYTGSRRILKVRWFGGITDRSVAWISNFCNFVPRMD